MRVFNIVMASASAALALSIGLTALGSRPGDLDYGSLFILIGALCTRSLLSTQLHLNVYRPWRRPFEIIGLSLLLLIPTIVFLQHNDFVGPASDPLVFVAVPLTGIGIYLFRVIKPANDA